MVSNSSTESLPVAFLHLERMHLLEMRVEGNAARLGKSTTSLHNLLVLGLQPHSI